MIAGLLLVLAIQAQTTPATPPAPASTPPPAQEGATPAETLVIVSYVPERVFDSRARKFSDFEAMLADLARADVIIVGEQHDDRNTHRLEAALLEGLMRRRGRLTLSLEMFERDAQPMLDEYLAGAVAEEAFLKQSRPWPAYQSDYRPLVEMARAHGWPVIASNVPRRLAAQVAKDGPAALQTLPAADRALAAQSIECPPDDYRKRFVATMNEHPMPGSDNLTAEERKARDDRFYQAQCLKDETMAEAVAAGFERHGAPLVHYTGAFHSDFADGTAARVKRRLKDARVVVVSMLPVDDLDTIKVEKADRKRADYLVFTLKPRPSPHTR